MRLLLSVLSLILIAVPVFADGLQPIEKIARANAKNQPALENYVVTVETDRVEQMLERMTANLPQDAVRPQSPTIRKYWQRNTGKNLIRAEGPNIFPYMQEMVSRFSGDFALELHGFILPSGRSGDRSRLAADAIIKTADNDLAGVKMQSTTIEFKRPSDLDGAFYGHGFKLPQKAVSRLTFEVDPAHEIVKRIEIAIEGGQVLSLEIRYREVVVGQFPEEMLLTSLDGSIENRFETKFDQFDGVWLPVRQKRYIRQGEKIEILKVSFVDYEINAEFPEDVKKLLAP